MVLVLLLVFLLLKFMVFLLLEVFQVVQLAAGVVVMVSDGDGDVVVVVVAIVLVLLPLLLLSPANPIMILMSQIPFLLLPLQGQLEFILSGLYSGAP